MRRLILLAIGLSALLWSATARTGPIAADDIETMAGGTACRLAANSQAPGDSDQQWRAQRHTIAAITESVWKSAFVHAELAAAPAARVFDLARQVSSPAPPLRPTPHYLRHTPLLI